MIDVVRIAATAITAMTRIMVATEEGERGRPGAGGETIIPTTIPKTNEGAGASRNEGEATAPTPTTAGAVGAAVVVPIEEKLMTMIRMTTTEVAGDAGVVKAGTMIEAEEQKNIFIQYTKTSNKKISNNLINPSYDHMILDIFYSIIIINTLFTLMNNTIKCLKTIMIKN